MLSFSKTFVSIWLNASYFVDQNHTNKNFGLTGQILEFVYRRFLGVVLTYLTNSSKKSTFPTRPKAGDIFDQTIEVENHPLVIQARKSAFPKDQNREIFSDEITGAENHFKINAGSVPYHKEDLNMRCFLY